MLVKFPVLGKVETQFWLRAFQLEAKIDHVAAIMNQDVHRKSGFCPIITTHEAGAIFFHIILATNVDSLGLSDGMGTIWLSTNKEHREEAERSWELMGNDVLKRVHESGKWDETFEIEPGREV